MFGEVRTKKAEGFGQGKIQNILSEDVQKTRKKKRGGGGGSYVPAGGGRESKTTP